MKGINKSDAMAAAIRLQTRRTEPKSSLLPIDADSSIILDTVAGYDWPTRWRCVYRLTGKNVVPGRVAPHFLQEWRQPEAFEPGANSRDWNQGKHRRPDFGASG